MKAKTTKFLAVLAVLAMAFAAFAVFAPSENDAADEDSKWTVPTGTDADKPSYITLGTDVIKPADGDTLVDATAYYVDTDMTLNIDKDADLTNGAILIFLKEGVTLDVIRPAGCQKVVVYSLFGVVESTDKVTGATILTLHDNYGAEDSKLDVMNHTKWVSTSDTLQFPKTWANSTGDSVTGYDKTYHGTDSRSHNTFYEGWDLEGKNRMLWRTPQDVTVNVEGATMNVHGDFLSLEYYGPMADPSTADSSVWTFQEATGTIGSVRTYDATTQAFFASANTATLDNFTGVIEMARVANSEGTDVDEIPVITKWISGDITVTEGTIFMAADAYIVEGSTLTFLEGTTVSKAVMSEGDKPVLVKGAFAYMDEYNDIHSFMTDNALSVGMGDFTITAGENKIIVDGTVTLNKVTSGADTAVGPTTYTFAGNATLSGMVYSEGNGLTLKNVTVDPKDGTTPMPADIKLRTFQVTDSTIVPGTVTLETSVLVETGCSFYVSGGMTINEGAILKIAEGAVVKPEGTLIIALPDATASPVKKGGSIWNAGQFIATGYSGSTTGQQTSTTYYDTQLIRVFMNTSYQTGTFYLGSSVYDGTAGTATGAQIPLTVAFGAYLDMTGIDKVNLTSGGINVNSGLYKYNTLILATFDNTIALTASFDNQYPVTVTLDGKASATPVFTAKSATFRNVVWQSPISATLYVTAPELYTVILAKTIENVLDEDDEPTGVYKAGDVWTSGLTIKDQNGRIIPIAADGTIKVVFGYEYTIEGANSTSNYKFMSPNKDLKDLTKDSKTTGSFTMIRNNVEKINISNDVDSPELVEAPVVLHITEGFATTLTVYLNDDDKKYSVGDVFMYYAIADDNGEAIGDGTAVVLQLDDDNQKVGIIRGIYSNDTILFKSEFVKFYKSTAIGSTAKNIIFPTKQVPDTSTDDPDDTITVNEDITFPSDKWCTTKFTFKQPTGDKKKVDASFQLKCELNTVDVYFKFGQYDANANPQYIDASQKIIVNFTEYCAKSKHTETVTTSLSDTIGTDIPDADKGTFKITMTVGEVYNVTWSPIDGYLSNMTYNKTSFDVGETDKTYAEGTAVIVAEKLYYTLSEQELIYIIVENQTDADLTLTIGQFSADIVKKKSNDKVIVNDGKKTLVLSKKGWTVEGWTFQIYQGAEQSTTPADWTVYKTIYVSGPQTTQTYQEYYDEVAGSTESPTGKVIKKIVITQADITMTRYFVNVLADDHGAIDPFDQTGYMDEVRKAYVTTQYGYNVVDVIYQYQEVDDPEIVEGHATKGTTPEGQEVWTYIMPASNVLLKPVIEKETRDLSFVDQTGELIEPTQKVAPRTEVNMPVPCKPLCVITDVTTEAEIEFEYDAETGYISFVMPDEDVVFVVTCEEIDYSKNVLVTIGQRGAAIALVITALDGKMIAPGSITMYVNYTYEEDGEVWTDAVEVTVEYESDGHSHGVILDETFIEELGEYYDGAFAVTGSYEFGYAAGEMSKTVYTPVLGA